MGSPSRRGGLIQLAKETALAGNVTIYSNAVQVGAKGSNFGVWFKATSVAGAPDVTVQYEESYTLPTTEGAADTNYVVPANAVDVCTNRIVETALVDSISPVAMKYLRFKIIGNAANNADTLVTLYLFEQED